MNANAIVSVRCVPELTGIDQNADKAFLSHSWVGPETSPVAATVFGMLAYTETEKNSQCPGSAAVKFFRYKQLPRENPTDSEMEISYSVVYCRKSQAIVRVATVEAFQPPGVRNTQTEMVRRIVQLRNASDWNVNNTLVLSTFARSVGDVWNDDGFACVAVFRNGSDVLITADWKALLDDGDFATDKLYVQLIEWNPSFATVHNTPQENVAAFTTVCAEPRRVVNTNGSSLQPFFTRWDSTTGAVEMPTPDIRAVTQWLQFASFAATTAVINMRIDLNTKNEKQAIPPTSRAVLWPVIVGTSNRFGQPTSAARFNWSSEQSAIHVQLERNDSLAIMRANVGPALDVIVALTEFKPQPPTTTTTKTTSPSNLTPSPSRITTAPTSSLITTTTTKSIEDNNNSTSSLPTTTSQTQLQTTTKSMMTALQTSLPVMMTTDSNEDSGGTIGIIVGCVVGGILLIAGIAAIVIFRKKRTSSTSTSNSNTPISTTTANNEPNYGRFPAMTSAREYNDPSDVRSLSQTSLREYEYSDIGDVRGTNTTVFS